METKEIKIQINVPEGKILVGTKVENGVIIPIFKDKEAEFSKTWEEWCTKNKRTNFVYINNSSEVKTNIAILNQSICPVSDKNLIISESRAKAFLALMQLINLRDEYRQGWEPDWKDGSDKHIITCFKTVIKCDACMGYNSILSFQSEKIRDKFLENFTELIEQAKELL